MSNTSQTVAIICKPVKDELSPIVQRLLEWLHAHGYKVIADPVTASRAPGCDVVEREAMAACQPAFVIVLGGDGTMLAAARAVAKAKIPILGVNIGSLGFLTEIALSEMYPTLEAMHEKRCCIELRSMLHCQLQREGKCLGDYEALNDIVVSKRTLARIADSDVFVNGVFICNYKADGLIVSTPTGSTAYSLAAGGPILVPDVEAFVITPVSPHSLTNRPLVVRENATIEIVVRSRSSEEIYLTVDGQVGAPLHEGDRILCRKSEHQVQLLRKNDQTFFDVLREKLKWGER